MDKEGDMGMNIDTGSKAKRREYRQPTLTVYGLVKELTQSSGTHNSDGGASKQNK